MKGTYTLLLSCRKPMRVRFGKLGEAWIGKGLYVYTGSALGRGAVSLEGRVKRHFRRPKGIKWHVDYLTSRPECDVIAAVYVRSRRRLECSLNRSVGERLKGKVILPRIGASDCKCDGHIITVKTSKSSRNVLKELREIYSKYGDPVVFSGFSA